MLIYLLQLSRIWTKMSTCGIQSVYSLQTDFTPSPLAITAVLHSNQIAEKK